MLRPDIERYVLSSEFDNPPGTAWTQFATTASDRPLTYECTLTGYDTLAETYSIVIFDGEAIPQEGADPDPGSYSRNVTFVFEALDPGSYELAFTITDQAANSENGPNFGFQIAE